MEQDTNLTNSQFQFGKKWFWIGMVAALNLAPGLVFGIALMTTEKERRKEGAIIATFTVVWFIFTAYVLGPWLMKKGILSKYIILKVK